MFFLQIYPLVFCSLAKEMMCSRLWFVLFDKEIYTNWDSDKEMGKDIHKESDEEEGVKMD